MYEIVVPATSANMGPGFDSMGIAVSLYNSIRVERAERHSVEIQGEGSGKIPTDERNLSNQAYRRTLERAGLEDIPVRMVQVNAVPASRGLGSSANAVVGGILCALAVGGLQWSQAEILEVANEMEGHPDNVAPAIYGGFTVTINDGGMPRCLRVPLYKGIQPVAMVPAFELSTRKAREALPKQVTLQDAAYNVGHAAYTAAAITTGNFSELRYAIQDKLHQPYRAKLIAGYDEIVQRCNELGAAAYLSGAGPTIMAIVPPEKADELVANMKTFVGDEWHILPLDIDNRGAYIKE